MGVKARLKKLEKEVDRLNSRVQDIARSKKAKSARPATKKRTASPPKSKGKANAATRSKRKESDTSSHRSRASSRS